MTKLLKSGFAAFCLAALTVSPAQAKVENVTVKINYDDLDLSDPGDVAKMRERMRSAVADACTPASSLPKSLFAGSVRSCISDAMKQAEAQLAEVTTIAPELAANS